MKFLRLRKRPKTSSAKDAPAQSGGIVGDIRGAAKPKAFMVEPHDWHGRFR